MLLFWPKTFGYHEPWQQVLCKFMHISMETIWISIWSNHWKMTPGWSKWLFETEISLGVEYFKTSITILDALLHSLNHAMNAVTPSSVPEGTKSDAIIDMFTLIFHMADIYLIIKLHGITLLPVNSTIPLFTDPQNATRSNRISWANLILFSSIQLKLFEMTK